VKGAANQSLPSSAAERLWFGASITSCFTFTQRVAEFGSLGISKHQDNDIANEYSNETKGQDSVVFLPCDGSHLYRSCRGAIR